MVEAEGAKVSRAHAVETRKVSIRETDGGTNIGHVPRGVKVKEVVTRQLDVQAVLEERVHCGTL